MNTKEPTRASANDAYLWWSTLAGALSIMKKATGGRERENAEKAAIRAIAKAAFIQGRESGTEMPEFFAWVDEFFR